MWWNGEVLLWDRNSMAQNPRLARQAAVQAGSLKKQWPCGSPTNRLLSEVVPTVGGEQLPRRRNGQPANPSPMWVVFRSISACVNLKAHPERRASSCGAGCSKNELVRPIIMPFSGAIWICHFYELTAR